MRRMSLCIVLKRMTDEMTFNLIDYFFPIQGTCVFFLVSQFYKGRRHVTDNGDNVGPGGLFESTL